MSDAVSNVLQSILYATVYKLLYYIGCGLLKLVSFFNSMFEAVSGLSLVIYDGKGDYLINIFFSNTAISKVYWGMALIGMAIAFGFAIIAVIRKIFDDGEKEKRSHGQILGGLVKSIIIIMSLSFMVTMVINATNVLMQQINYVFSNVETMGEEDSIVYTEEQLAAMARVLNTIGNYSMNPSYDNRYNLNSCFNEIQQDMLYLSEEGVFDFYYSTKDLQGNEIATWQSALQNVANAASLKSELKMDVYYESVSNALLDTMELLRVNGQFKPLASYERQYTSYRHAVPLDRMIYLMSTMTAAKNDDYNVNGAMTDNLRGPYYSGEKSIYDLKTVNKDFDIGIGATDYVVLFLAGWKLLWSLATIILNCIARIFNVLFLYLIAPPVIAVMPLDDGGKFKQWLTAFIVQTFSVFGTVLSMRVMLLFLPVIVDSKLEIFADPFANLLAKLVIIMGGFEVTEKATSLITGILADNAGWQSITAGDMSQTANSAMGKTFSGALTTAKYAGIGGVGVALGAGFAGYGTVKGAGTLVGKGKDGVVALADKISAWRAERNAANNTVPEAPEFKGQIPEKSAPTKDSAPVTENTLADIKKNLQSPPTTESTLNQIKHNLRPTPGGIGSASGGAYGPILGRVLDDNAGGAGGVNNAGGAGGVNNAGGVGNVGGAGNNTVPEAPEFKGQIPEKSAPTKDSAPVTENTLADIKKNLQSPPTTESTLNQIKHNLRPTPGGIGSASGVGNVGGAGNGDRARVDRGNVNVGNVGGAGNGDRARVDRGNVNVGNVGGAGSGDRAGVDRGNVNVGGAGGVDRAGVDRGNVNVGGVGGVGGVGNVGGAGGVDRAGVDRGNVNAGNAGGAGRGNNPKPPPMAFNRRPPGGDGNLPRRE